MCVCVCVCECVCVYALVGVYMYTGSYKHSITSHSGHLHTMVTLWLVSATTLCMHLYHHLYCSHIHNVTKQFSPLGDHFRQVMKYLVLCEHTHPVVLFSIKCSLTFFFLPTNLVIWGFLIYTTLTRAHHTRNHTTLL